MAAKRKRKQKEQKARDRATIILQVRSGLITATEGAKRLGVSRKTYYEWENRALDAMASALEDRSAGRPSLPRDPEKEALERKVAELTKEAELMAEISRIREKAAELRGMGLLPESSRDAKKKDKRKRKSSNK